MPKLYTYTIPVDDGAAPNPFFGMCTLAICKPVIRRTAQEGDWVVGLGSVNAPSGDLSGRVVYAMEVGMVLTLNEYDKRARTEWPHRIPNISSRSLPERLGDCIYSFENGKVIQRPSVHDAGNVETDLGGKNVLISTNFYYYGRNAIGLPPELREICHQTQGHRSDLNQPYLDDFVSWLKLEARSPGQLYGWPDFIVDWNEDSGCSSCSIREKVNRNKINC